MISNRRIRPAKNVRMGLPPWLEGVRIVLHCTAVVFGGAAIFLTILAIIALINGCAGADPGTIPTPEPLPQKCDCESVKDAIDPNAWWVVLDCRHGSCGFRCITPRHEAACQVVGNMCRGQWCEAS